MTHLEHFILDFWTIMAPFALGIYIGRHLLPKQGD